MTLCFSGQGAFGLFPEFFPSKRRSGPAGSSPSSIFDKMDLAVVPGQLDCSGLVGLQIVDDRLERTELAGIVRAIGLKGA